MSHPKTIFLTGATGLVGSHVAEEALRRGHHVRAPVRSSSDTRLLDAWGVEKVEGDLADADALARGVAGADWVFNCAAKVGDWGTLEEFRRLNVAALRVLLDVALAAGVERFVHVSSLGVYEGRDHFGSDETVPPAAEALDGYTRSKVEAEALALEYHATRGLPVAIVRPGFIYGERDRTVLPKLLTNLRNGRFTYFGSGDQALNCIYVKNLVQAIFLAAEVPVAVGEVFNITDGRRVSKREFVSEVATRAGLRPPTRRIPLWLAWTLAVLLERRAKRLKSDTPPLVNKARYKFLGLNLDFSCEKARRVLGYEPRFTTSQGLEAALADLAPQPARPSRPTPAEPSPPEPPLRSPPPGMTDRTTGSSPEGPASGAHTMAATIQGKRVAVLVEKLYEDLELWYPVLRLREAGASVTIVGPKAGDSYLSKHGYPARADASAADVRAEDFDAVIIPGGYSPDHMRRHKAMVDLVTHACKQRRVVAAICHGPWMLCSTKQLQGRRVTGFHSIRDDVENAGATWEDAPCVVDANLVTSRTPDDLPAFMKGIFDALMVSAEDTVEYPVNSLRR